MISDKDPESKLAVMDKASAVWKILAKQKTKGAEELTKGVRDGQRSGTVSRVGAGTVGFAEGLAERPPLPSIFLNIWSYPKSGF